MSLYTRPITVSLLESGLVGTLYYVVYDENRNVLVARTANGIAEQGTSAIYFSYVPNWNSEWIGTIEWDVDETNVAIEDFQMNAGQDVLALLRANSSVTFGTENFAFTSYVNVEGANSYFRTRLNTEAWDYANYEQQFKALCEGTRIIDRLNFIGVKVDSAQSQQWPRTIRGVDQTPTDILIAICEIAISLLDGVDPDLEDELIASNSDAYATVRVTSDSTVARDHVKAGVPSVEAWRYLLPWLHDGRTIRIRKA